MAGRWVDVGEASRELEISSDAVRKRIARGSLRSDKQDGNVLVWLDNIGTEAGREAQVEGAQVLIESLQDQVTYLRSVLNEERDARRRADTIIAQLTQANAALAQRIPELEAPQEPPGGPQSAAEGRESGEEKTRPGGEEAQEGAQRPWWRRMFGG